MRSLDSPFIYQLSRFERTSVSRKKLAFMVKQLEKYGDVEGIDFVYRDDPDTRLTALYTLGDRRVSYTHYDPKYPAQEVSDEGTYE